jgi:hypothetical protein
MWRKMTGLYQRQNRQTGLKIASSIVMIENRQHLMAGRDSPSSHGHPTDPLPVYLYVAFFQKMICLRMFVAIYRMSAY